MTSRLAKLAWATVACGLPFTGALAQQPQTSRVSLPGFSISLPAGSVIEDGKQAAGGQHVRALSQDALAGIPHLDNPEARVMWLARSMTYDEFRNQFLPAASAMMPSTIEGKVLHVENVSEGRFLAVFGNASLPIGVGVVNCPVDLGIGILLKLHSTAGPQLEAIQAMVKSVRCAREPVLVDRPRAAVRLSKDFGRVLQPKSQRYQSLDGEIIEILATEGSAHPESDPLERALAAVTQMDLERPMKREWVKNLAIDERADLRPTRLFRVDIPDARSPFYYGELYCEGSGFDLFAKIELQRKNDALAELRLSQIGCPDDKSVEPPEFAKIAEEACRKGDARGCDAKPR